MKTLYIAISLIILCGLTYAQTDIEGGGYVGKSPDNPVTVTLDTVAFIEMFIDLWDTYKAECWADSTEIVRQVDMGVFPVLKYEKVWTHREPDFKGFMEYLKRRVK